jgi:transposase
MTKAQVEVITSVQRRRRWSRAEKEQVVAASLEPGATVIAVAREFGVHASQVFRWRQRLCGKATASGFAAVTVAAQPTASGGVIEVELGIGVRLRISGAADAATVSAVIAALTAGAR